MATMRGKSSSLLLRQEYSATYRPGICTTASPALSSGLVWTDTFLVPVTCGRKTFLISILVRLRYRPRVAPALVIEERWLLPSPKHLFTDKQNHNCYSVWLAASHPSQRNRNYNFLILWKVTLRYWTLLSEHWLSSQSWEHPTCVSEHGVPGSPYLIFFNCIGWFVGFLCSLSPVFYFTCFCIVHASFLS